MSQIHSKSFKMPASTINSYSRLSYTPWHAIAEFIDNSTQSYFDNKEALDDVFKLQGDSMFVSVTYDRNEQTLTIRDNSIGMSFSELEVALDVAPSPPKIGSRSKYGMGLKTAACWFGAKWSIKTKKLGDDREYTAVFDVARVASGQDIPIEEIGGFDENLHYTEIIIENVRMRLNGRTKGKIRDFLTSMYRYDILDGGVTLLWEQTELDALNFLNDLQPKEGSGTWYKEFSFQVGEKEVTGCVGVLQNGSRAKAGFSIMQNRRQIRGHPDSWRPTSLFGQFQGTNDLINQRLIGVVNLDGFEVSHTKDDIIWHGDEESELEKKLKIECWEFRQQASRSHKSMRDEREPNSLESDVAFDKIRDELNSSELIDLLDLIEDLPPEQVIDDSVEEFVKEKPGEVVSV
ncbi:MAG: ATP-binding protein, partial [Bacteroidota bacterium]